MSKFHFRILFLLFLLSGFCSLLYQVVWIRMAYASFGIITPVLSVVISVYMLGLSIGSWLGGKWILKAENPNTPIHLYAITELMIGVGAFAVPFLFSLGRKFLLSSGDLNSFSYLFHSAAMITVSILPWCIFMGLTFPVMMSFLKQCGPDSQSGFSYLYFANVIGAALGTIITAVVLIELLGFKQTLATAACFNFIIAGMAAFIGRSYPKTKKKSPENKILPLKTPFIRNDLSRRKSILICSLLFVTGLISMSMEVVWIRAFTPVLKNLTYSFASLLSVYLTGTLAGTFLYRKHIEKNQIISNEKLISALAAFALLPIVMNDPRMYPGVFSVLISIFPLCSVMGYITPKLIDQYSLGEPLAGGKAYAINIIGCILGPLLASYLLLPYLGVKKSLLLLSAPFLMILLLYCKKELSRFGWSMAMCGLALFFFFRSAYVHVSYEDLYASIPGSETRRDHTGTVVSYGTGLQKKLLVNGIGITALTPITKAMAHLPLALCPQKPESALVICFGMGTTFRSLLSWDIRTTAVELVPSVRDAFGYYFKDAHELMANPKADIIIDDGRRYLSRTSEMFDVITIDPPPPIEAAGSSLLYSEEFYELVKKRLKNGGVLQQWFPAGEKDVLHAVARALANSFPYVVAYPSMENWGIHFLAARHPLPGTDVQTIYDRIPANARKDFLEWLQQKNLKKILHTTFDSGSIIDDILQQDNACSITDDKPYNEYYLIRKWLDRF